MLNYSLNNLISELVSAIKNMEMKGFDITYDSNWYGYSEFEIEFEDCSVIIKGHVCKLYDIDGNLDSRNMNIEKNYIQFEDDKKYLSASDILKIEEGLKL